MPGTPRDRVPSDVQSAFPDGFGIGTYGSSFVDVYDRWYADITDAHATAAFMAQRCPRTTVVELGVGTGRLVEALRERGLLVLGVDASLPMLAGLPDESVGICADIAALPIRPGAIGGALCAFNTLFNLPSAELQGRLFAEAAAITAGPIVIEAMTGVGLAQADRQSVGVSRMTVDSLVLAATVVDHDAQTVTGQHVEITESGVRLRPWHLRWSTTDQLDALAADAGLTLTERFAGWTAEPFRSDSETHVSVYTRTDQP